MCKENIVVYLWKSLTSIKQTKNKQANSIPKTYKSIASTNEQMMTFASENPAVRNKVTTCVDERKRKTKQRNGKDERTNRNGKEERERGTEKTKIWEEGKRETFTDERRRLKPVVRKKQTETIWGRSSGEGGGHLGAVAAYRGGAAVLTHRGGQRRRSEEEEGREDEGGSRKKSCNLHTDAGEQRERVRESFCVRAIVICCMCCTDVIRLH